MLLIVQDRQREQQERADGEEVDYAFKLAALYITLAFALQPKRDVYKRSLKVSNQCKLARSWSSMLL